MIGKRNVLLYAMNVDEILRMNDHMLGYLSELPHGGYISLSKKSRQLDPLG